jgi:phage-related minor tail protein
MPEEWSPLHDRAICILDTRGYSHEDMVKKVKSNFVELQRKVLTPAMVDKQLRILDQRIEIPYWRVGLATLKDDSQEDNKRGRTLSPKAADDKSKNRSPSKIPRRSGEAGSRPSATKDRTHSPSKTPRKDGESGPRARDSAQDLYALIAQKEAEELAKITAREKEKTENWKPRGPRSKNDVEVRQPLGETHSGYR